ncbi:MAG: putative glycoside hydrolase [Nanoarchaeota archaeon]|mgnify:CR=1 FL=1
MIKKLLILAISVVMLLSIMLTAQTCVKLPICGDGEVNQASEQCDKLDFNDHTCQTEGFSSGMLNCNNDCTISTMSCQTQMPQSQLIQNYIILGNNWGGGSASQDELDYYITRYSMAQEFRDWEGKPLIEAGGQNILKYRLGGSLFDISLSSAPERMDIWEKATGQRSGYMDIRLKKEDGGYMQRKDGKEWLLDLSTQENVNQWSQILIESLEPYLEEQDPPFHGIFFDVANLQDMNGYQGVPAPSSGEEYSKGSQHDGLVNVYRQVRNRFPEGIIILNGHNPWERSSTFQKDPSLPEYSGRRLVMDSGADGIMVENRMLSGGPSISSWTSAAIQDISYLLDNGKKVIVTYAFGEDQPNFNAQRKWALATYLIATGNNRNAYFGMDQVGGGELPDYPEQTFDIGKELGEPISGILEESNGEVLRRNFENGIVLAHVRNDGTPQEITIPGEYEALRLNGGGVYDMEDTPQGMINWDGDIFEQLLPPTQQIVDGSALILREIR